MIENSRVHDEVVDFVEGHHAVGRVFERHCDERDV